MKFGDETDHGAVCSDVVASILPCAFVGGVLFVFSISCDDGEGMREVCGKCGGAALAVVGKTLLRICAASALLCAAFVGLIFASVYLHFM